MLNAFSHNAARWGDECPNDDADEQEAKGRKWINVHEGATSDVENLVDYVERLSDPGVDSLEQIDEARGYVKFLSASLDALERLAR